MTSHTKEQPSYLLALAECNHTLTFQLGYLPEIGSEVWCMRCILYRHAAYVVGMYRARCDSCRFARTYGAAKLTALNRADRHAHRYPGHAVTVTLGNAVVGTSQIAAGQISLEELLDVPPF